MNLTSSQPFKGLEGFVTENAPLARYTWYRIGGPAKYLITPRSLDELQDAVQRCLSNAIDIYVLGLGANLLVNDFGVPGAVFRLSEECWRQVRFQGNALEVGAGVDMQKLLLRTVKEGKSGIECLAGIPGTVGGGIRMNAGGKFGDFGSAISSVTVMELDGTISTKTKDEIVFDYRRTDITAPFILSATLELEDEDPDAIMKRTKEIWMYKRNTQPLNTKNCGCIFKNPRGLSAGALIDQTGLKGLRIGNAEVSDKHANFIVAHPGCSSADVMKLIETVRDRVLEKHQVQLESEVKMWP